MTRPARIKGLHATFRMHWPHDRPYREQRTMLESVALNNETVLVAGNELGKGWMAGRVTVLFFLYPQLFFPASYVRAVERLRRPGAPDYLTHTRRIVTTSVKEKHLGVLWAEIGAALTTSAIPLLESQGGPLVVNDLMIKFKEEAEVKKPMNYCMGQTAIEGVSFAGHHARYAMFVGDEISSMNSEHLNQARGWMNKFLGFGNPNPSPFFEGLVRGGDVA